jgi:hypothetical protein
MYAEPKDFDRAALADALRTHWDIDAKTMRYHAAGFGTHHYVIGDDEWFVNVDDLSKGSDPDVFYDQLVHSLRTAVALRGAGLEFVLAPIDGTVARLDGGYAVSVYPFVEGWSGDYGEYEDDAERRVVLEMLREIHAATDRLPPDVPRRETFDVRFRDEYYVALASPDWESGPYADRAQELLAQWAASIDERFARYDDLVRRVRKRATFVITHGEPHAANLLHLPDGSVRLIDWDTAALAPGERDLWQVSGGGDPDALALYDLQWTLAEIAVYTKTFFDPHDDDANTRESWTNFEHYIRRVD